MIVTGRLWPMLAAFACTRPVEPVTLTCVQLASAPGVVVWISPIPNMRCVVPT